MQQRAQVGHTLVYLPVHAEGLQIGEQLDNPDEFPGPLLLQVNVHNWPGVDHLLKLPLLLLIPLGLLHKVVHYLNLNPAVSGGVGEEANCNVAAGHAADQTGQEESVTRVLVGLHSPTDLIR
jgi:hypothetical protein